MQIFEKIKYTEQYRANRSYHIGYKKAKNPDAYFRRYESQIILNVINLRKIIVMEIGKFSLEQLFFVFRENFRKNHSNFQ